MQISLENSAKLELDASAPVTGRELAKVLKKDLEGSPLAVRVNGVLKDLNTELKDGDTAAIVTFASAEGRHLFWHSSAHILAQAVKRLFPDAKPTIGPAIEEGFFYDFADLQVTDEDLKRIEAEVQKIVKERLEPQRIVFKDEAAARKEFADNKFKLEIMQNREEELSAYRQGDFIDLCTGPHIPSTQLVQGFKVLKTSGAYWRGDAKNEQLTRIYGISFPDKKELKDWVHRMEEARKRDHRVIGRKLDLYSFHEEAPGMPFFHPAGMALWEEMLKLERELHYQGNYTEIKTPIMLTRELWQTSGHWDYYRENMYTSQVEERDFAIKPMNCPGGMLYYKNAQYSYRQLPLRVAEFGNVHRHEMSGALSGLFRVRSFHQDDAHIFMKPSDMIAEIQGVLKLAETIYSQFGLQYHLELSTRPEKSIGNDAQWEQATAGLQGALDAGQYEYKINPGDGAFYGPKIDIHIKDAIGRTWQCGTIQLDMSLPERFDLLYITESGDKERPIMIHRAIYGSLERFLGIVVEHYAGKFPLWFSPRQARILTVADRHHEYASQVEQQFKDAGLRVSVDDSAESVPKKVRNAQLDQVNYILVVGDAELSAKTVNVRTRANEVLGERAVDAVIAGLLDEYQKRSSEPLLT
ncbi:MAG: threonine--tRNA ligase [Leptospiraceae bacterium]|nr:threonine--tRNA ligase [Leptospiraceae bacterium]